MLALLSGAGFRQSSYSGLPFIAVIARHGPRGGLRWGRKVQFHPNPDPAPPTNIAPTISGKPDSAVTLDQAYDFQHVTLAIELAIADHDPDLKITNDAGIRRNDVVDSPVIGTVLNRNRHICWVVVGIVDVHILHTDRERRAFLCCRWILPGNDRCIVDINDIAGAVSAIGIVVKKQPGRGACPNFRVPESSLRPAQLAPFAVVIEQGVLVSEFGDLWIRVFTEGLEGRSPPSAAQARNRAVDLVFSVGVFPGQVPRCVAVVPQVHSALPLWRGAVVHLVGMVGVVQLFLCMSTLVDIMRDIAGQIGKVCEPLATRASLAVRAGVARETRPRKQAEPAGIHNITPIDTDNLESVMDARCRRRVDNVWILK